jgi:hypothetical protein
VLPRGPEPRMVLRLGRSGRRGGKLVELLRGHGPTLKRVTAEGGREAAARVCRASRRPAQALVLQGDSLGPGARAVAVGRQAEAPGGGASWTSRTRRPIGAGAPAAAPHLRSLTIEGGRGSPMPGGRLPRLHPAIAQDPHPRLPSAPSWSRCCVSCPPCCRRAGPASRRSR